MSSPSRSANGEASRNDRAESRLPTWDDARASAYFNFDLMEPKSLKGAFLLGLGYSVAKSAWSSFQAYRGRRLEQEDEKRAEEAREREEETRRRQAEFRRQLHEDLGIDGEAGITQQEITTARNEINYVDEAMNIVVTGNLNAGKSSLINALRNLRFHDDGYAPTGAAETTRTQHQYIDPIHPGYIWYDTPGAGTLETSAWGYYLRERLFAYDAVILSHDSTLTQSVIRIMLVCHLIHQPYYLVRTKKDMHIENYVRERHIPHAEARNIYMAEARRDLDRLQQQSQIMDVNLDLDDYLISSDGIRHIITGQTPPNNIHIDEERFLNNLGVLFEREEVQES